MEANKIAVGVGYCFNVFDDYLLSLIKLKKTERQVVLKDTTYDLYEGETFKDSKKIDYLLDIYGEYRTK